MAIEIKPDYAEAYYNRGNALQALERVGEAIASYDRAIEIKPDYAEAHCNRGGALEALKRVGEAIASYDRAIEIKPDYAEAHSNRGVAFQALERVGEAIASYDRAIEIKPDFAEACYNRGTALQALKRVGEAVASYERAIEIKPDYAEAHSNRGNALQALKRMEEAVASYDRAIEIKPDFVEAYYNRCIIRLVLRDFHKGFVDFKYRWDTKHFSTKPQKTTISSSAKTGLNGRLLIWAEQGLGDEIFYAGLLPLLSKEDVSIALSADKRLHPIYRRSFPKVDLLDKDILMNSSVDTGFDAQAPIGDLGLLLDVDAAAIQATRSPYLMSDTVKRDSYRKTISEFGSGLMCGVAWKSVNPKFGTEKSIDLDSFEPLLGLPGVHFINLQYGEVKEEIQQIKSSLLVDIHQVPDIDVFNDIEGLLALIDACDVIVTTSNVTAHLAGSIGKRAAVLVPYSTGKIWYWHHNDERSFWYPSLKLFYQDNPLTWDKTIGDCANWVKGLR
jgi:tetratricopeptide (TPR) repeat protein